MLRGESAPTREKQRETNRKKGDWRGLGSRFPFPNNFRSIMSTRTDGIYKIRADCEKG
jgi:hypothetical protein